MFIKMANFWKYLTNKVNYIILYNFNNIDKEIVKLWKFIGKNVKIYDNELKSYIHILNIGALSKMQIPINEKSSLNLIHGFLTFQIYLNSTKSFTIEIAISDNNYNKKRILLSACSKEFIINQMHCRIPIINIPTGVWINFSIDILSFVSECFKGQSFRAIDSICLSADCKIRRICGMRQLYTLSEEEYSQGDDTILPKGFLFPNYIKYINFNLDMDYVRENMESKNIKNNNHLNKNKKIYPKTSQSKREGNRYNHILNQDKENQKLNNAGGLTKIERKNSLINNTKIKNNTDVKQKLIKNIHSLKENIELNRGSSKNIRGMNGLKVIKNEQKENNKMLSTMKKDEIKNIYNVNNRKDKEKYNSKSVKKVYVKNDTNNNVKKKYNNNTLRRNIYNNLNAQLEKNTKDKSVVNEKENLSNIQKNTKNDKNHDMNLDNKEKPNINKISQIIQINQVLINNNTNNNIISKEDFNLFNTFNYKDLESKENTLLVNQSNFNNASIPEIVDLDINNTLIKNVENDVNINKNKEMILIDKNNRNEKQYIKNMEKMDSLFGDKILAEINNTPTLERPYTPPIQKIIPVNEDNNNATNNVNISKINESILQNHYCDLVYDNETGSLFDKKTKIYYDLK